MAAPDQTVKFDNHGGIVLSDANDICRQIALTLGDQGWCVTENFLSPLLIAQLRHETKQLWRKGRFRHAGVGRGDSFEINPRLRTDHVLWLDSANVSGAQQKYFDTVEQLRLAINRELFLGLLQFEAHIALYPKGSFYKKHLDQFRGIGDRTVSVILYLNKDWRQEHGGQLRLYTDHRNPEFYIDILPQGGTLVSFLSARYLHEVLPANRPRKSITGWFSRRDAGRL